MINEFKVITLCGSTRFKEQFLEVQKRLTLEGNVVISVGLFGHSGDEEVWKPGIKEMLDRMHLSKIDMADEIFVINVDGYIGESTQREISYALAHGKTVNYLEQPHDMLNNEQQATLKGDIVEHWDSLEEKNRNLEIELYHAKQSIKYLMNLLDTPSTSFIDEYMREHMTDYHLYQLFSCKLVDLASDFSTRTLNVLNNNNIKTIGDLIRYSEPEIKKLEGLGKLCFKELYDLLEMLNLNFGYDVDSIENAYHLVYIELREQIRKFIPILNIKIEETQFIHKDYFNELLSKFKISTIGDVASLHKSELLYYFHSEDMVNDISTFLKDYGLHLGYNVNEIYEEYESMVKHGYKIN